MSKPDDLTTRYRKTVSLMEMQYRSLRAAGASNDVLSTYARVVAYLRRVSPSEVLGLEGREPPKRSEFARQLVGDFDVDKLSLDEIEKIASAETTPRRILEKVAISRFHVPKGSMRSFQNIGMLREKLLILIQNERTHQTINQLARSPRS